MYFTFYNESQRRLFDTALAAFGGVGYQGNLVEIDYKYPDRFASHHPERKADAALFGRVPVSYETATVGIVVSNGVRGARLVNEHRSLGAPIVLEVRDGDLGLWTVGRDEAATRLQHRFDAAGFQNWVSKHAEELRPLEFLRTKDFRGGPAFFQESLFAGLIPELEEEIGRTLDPLLRRAFSAGQIAYRRTAGLAPPEPQLFKLAFWFLTGKVFSDRRHPGFAGLGKSADPDDVLNNVADHYNEKVGRILNQETREEVFRRIWNRMDFRNLSTEVLAQIWSRTLVTPETRKRLGIHRTRRSVVRYIVEHIPFEDFAPDDRVVLEPCSGSATFLLGAIDRMRDIADVGDPVIRHAYFQRMLRGIERDPFGVEIGRLCLALADYPNPNGWKIEQGDVFRGHKLAEAVAESRIILCNPPFEKFSDEERREYAARFWLRPAELLSRILDHLRPDAVIGFVLPRTFLDGQDYREVRGRLVERFSEIDLVSLPDKGWDFAAPETVLLTAKGQRREGRATVTHAVVREKDWQAFDWFHEVGARDSDIRTVEEARDTLAVPELRDIWKYLEYCPKLGSVAEAHKGIEWKVALETHEDVLVRDVVFAHSKPGVPPRAKFYSFERPPTRYLNFSEEYRLYDAFDRPWDRPKVIMNKTRRSRDMWRVAAFADFDGLACFETFFALWPEDPKMTVPLAAVLNGPVANAFLAVHCGRREFTIKAVLAIPFPLFAKEQVAEIGRLVMAYKSAAAEGLWPVSQGSPGDADRLLREIDAIVLKAYGLPPRLERRLLDSFIGSRRLVPFPFADYYPAGFEPCFSLSSWIGRQHDRDSVAAFRDLARDVPDHIAEAMRWVVDQGEEDEG